MSKVRLNEKSIRRPAPASGQIELWDDITPGFGLRISAGGARTYFVMKRLNGKLVRRTVGRAPQPSATAGAKLPEGVYWPSEARKHARDRLADLEIGTDPGLRRKSPALRAPAAPEAASGTFKATADAYLADKLKGGGAHLRSRAELERKLKVDLVAWHARPIASIKGREIREMVREKAQTSPISANRLLSFIKRVFRWAASEDIIDADPAASVSKPGDENQRTRYLDEREIGLFWRACDKMGDPAGRMFQLALLTAQRRGEVAGLLRSELGKLSYKVRAPDGKKERVVEGDAWLLPAERTKRGVPHTVPLSPLALELISGAPKLAARGKVFDHVFASGARGDQPVTGWSRFKARLDDFIGREIAKDADEPYDLERHSLPAWHLHDLRATAATFMETRLDVPRRVVSRVLNHAEGDGKSMTARYVRHNWDGEAADALNRWAELVARIAGLNVVKLGRASK
jgi:integrase